MKAFYKGIFAGVLLLVLGGASIAAVLPREQNCNKFKALSIASEILIDKIQVQVHNTSVCSYEGFLWVEVRDSNLKIPREGGQFAKLYTFNAKSTEGYEANLPSLVHGKTYLLSVFVNERTPNSDGERLILYEKQFVFGEG